MLKSILECFGDLPRGRIVIWLIEELPAGCGHDQPARDLHHKKRDAEKSENFTAEKRRNNQKHKPVGRDFSGQYFLSGLRIVFGEAEKNRSVAERIYNREQRCKRDAERLDEVDYAEFHSIYCEMKNSSFFGESPLTCS